MEIEIIKYLGREWFLSFWSSFGRLKKTTTSTRGGPVWTCTSDCSRRLKLNLEDAGSTHLILWVKIVNSQPRRVALG